MQQINTDGSRTIYLVTGNPNKLRELTAIAPASLQFQAYDLEIDEIQSLDQHKIVCNKLKQAYDVVKAPVILEDVSAELASLNGLPGPFIKFFEKQLGKDALYTLTKVENDHVRICCLAGYYDGEHMLFGEGVITGTIVAPRGENGFGFDSVVVPDNQELGPGATPRTSAEMTADEKNAISHRALAFKNLLDRLEVK